MTLNEDDWRTRGLCTQVDPELFFQDDEESVAAARSLCGRCEVQPDCKRSALANTVSHGFEAGMTAAERLAHPDAHRVAPLASFLPPTDEQLAEAWAAATRRRARRTAAEARRRAQPVSFDDLVHPFDRKATL